MSSVLKTLVGDDVDLLDFEDLAGRLGSRLQQPHVDDLVGHLQAECSHGLHDCCISGFRPKFEGVMTAKGPAAAPSRGSQAAGLPTQHTRYAYACPVSER